MAKRKYSPRPDGRYHTTVWDGARNADGSKHRVDVYSDKSSADLERKVNAIKRKVAEGSYTLKSDMLFIDYARSWLQTYKASRSLNTQQMYDNCIKTHLTAFEGLQLTDFRRSHIQGLINDRADHPRTCEIILLTVKQIVSAAVADKLLPATAPQDICTGISRPKRRRKEKRPLTAMEKEAIKLADFTDRERAFVLIIYGCGLRRGEALALCRSDIYPERAELTVNKALAFDGNDPYIKDTKSENGARTVHMPGYLVAFLQDYLPGLNGMQLFTTRDGRLMTKSGYDKMWAAIVRKLNVAAGGTDDLRLIYDLTAHIFRHNFCTELCYQIPKISIKKIAQMLGDSQKMVLEVYDHIIEENEKVEEAVENAVAL